jgi:hypothetical protein
MSYNEYTVYASTMSYIEYTVHVHGSIQNVLLSLAGSPRAAVNKNKQLAIILQW